MTDKSLEALIEKEFVYMATDPEADKAVRKSVYQIAQKYAEMKIKEFTQGVLDQYPILHPQSSNKKK